MIKKILLLNFFLFCVIFSSVAQKFEFGLKGGANVASQKLSDITGVESITGYHLGGFIYFKIPILFGIQAEANYSEQGRKLNNTEFNFDYINIPILIRSDFGPLNFHFGPQFGILTNASNNLGTSIKSQYKNRDFSLVAGIGLRLPARLGLTLRYVKGLKNISDPNVINEETRNTMFQFSIKFSLIQLGSGKGNPK